jgi:hypothetical protein
MVGKGFCYGVYDLLAALMLVLANDFILLPAGSRSPKSRRCQ